MNTEKIKKAIKYWENEAFEYERHGEPVGDVKQFLTLLKELQQEQPSQFNDDIAIKLREEALKQTLHYSAQEQPSGELTIKVGDFYLTSDGRKVQWTQELDDLAKEHWQMFNEYPTLPQPLPQSQQQEQGEGEAIEFAQWISNNQFTCYNNLWTSTKMYYAGRVYSIKELYQEFKKSQTQQPQQP